MGKLANREGIINKTTLKKLKKHKSLMEAAYELFTTKGVKNTAISDIVKKAGVAKGTFYLYFNNKYDLIDKIILKKTSAIIRDAIAFAHKREQENFTERLIIAFDYIIETLKRDTKLLQLIYKDLSAGLYTKVFKDPYSIEEVNSIINIISKNIVGNGYTAEEAKQLLFIIMELVGGVTYTAIIAKEPYSIDEIKPTLFNSIRRLLNNK